MLFGLLIWRLPDFDPAEMVPTWDAGSAAWLAASALVLLAAFALQTLRWDQVLRALGHRVPFARLFDQFLAGQFVSNVLPTTFAGDIVRIARCGRDIDDRPVAFASIALERLTGWLVLPTISLVTIALAPQVSGLGAATWTALAINVVTLGALIAILVVAGLPRWSGSARTAPGWRHWIGSVHLGILALRSTPRAVARTLAAGVGFQLVQCLSLWCAARALDIEVVGLVAVLAFFPPTAISQNLPIGFGGLGVREGGFVLFFGALGATDERAVALGLVTYLITVATSALGAPSFIRAGGRRALEADTAITAGPS